MGGFIPDIVAAVISCETWINPTLFTFSNGIECTTIETLKQGLYTSTGGTDIIEVTKHIKSSKFTNVVLLTDGYVGPPAEETVLLHTKYHHVVPPKKGFEKIWKFSNPSSMKFSNIQKVKSHHEIPTFNITLPIPKPL